MSTEIDRDTIAEAYDDVRSDASETNWLVLAYEGNSIVLESSGIEYDDFLGKFTDDVRLFGFVRIFVGDEMSRRAKFAFVSWVGNDVSPLKRAKMSTDKTEVTGVIKSFAVAIQASEQEELQLAAITEQLNKAGGANYGTGVREEA